MGFNSVFNVRRCKNVGDISILPFLFLTIFLGKQIHLFGFDFFLNFNLKYLIFPLRKLENPVLYALQTSLTASALISLGVSNSHFLIYIF
jgi:hypothetical protein